MRVAVTGASGFLGQHVVRALRERDVHVVAVSRHPDLPSDNGTTPCALDIAEAGADALTRIGNPDVLLHLAWGGLQNYRSAHHLEHELPMHAAFLESCVRSGLKRIVVVGTCLEYGLQSGELDETMVIMPVVPYAQAKHALHARLCALRERHAFGLGWLRPFYLYGPGQAPTSLYSQLRAAVDSGTDRFDMSQGAQMRDFLAIKEAASHIAALTLTHPDMGAVNVCSGIPASVIDTVRGWLRGWKADIVLNCGVLPFPDYEPFAFWGSTRRLHALLEST